MRVTITMPLPSRTLSPNGRSHWIPKSQAVAKYRQLAAAEAWVALRLEASLRQICPWQAASIEIRYFAKTRRWPDRDNIIATMKSAIDGLTDGGLLADDRDVQYLPVVRDVDRLRPRVELIVTELP